MSDELSNAVVGSVKYYLSRIEHILSRLKDDPDAARYLEVKLAQDMLDTGFNFAVAIKFAARALCPPAELDMPEIPEDKTCATLLAYVEEVRRVIHPITADQARASVTHIAGEGELHQSAEDYITEFALPNMIFHISIAYAGLRHAGFDIGKADFDGLHVY